MDLYYLPLIVLIALASSDLVVGVANDAVNFTNSAVGSHVAPRWAIFLTASIGILIGTTFSVGMLEIARKGLFYPQFYTFENVLTIFMAVMFTDILLLDMFNTYGLPTSTTVSLVFELLGASVAVGGIILLQSGSDLSMIGTYINSDRALLMISGILLSILFAFIFGVLIQFISRLIFSFKKKRSYAVIGAVWSALAISFILYYILIKGVKNSIFLSSALVTWIHAHTWPVLLVFFTVCLVLFIIFSLFKIIDPLKIVVLAGTFALALTFASNDLVNFIGVPLAGFFSYQIAEAAGSNSNLLMSGLNDPLEVPVFFILSAALIMIITLWRSKKAQTVTRTEIELASQHKSKARFGDSKAANFLVDVGLKIFKFGKFILPRFIKEWIEERYKGKHHEHKEADKGEPAFDLVRASVNLMVASTLIALGTSMKLPLSTTYVTFIVAMGTSLADGAWGKQSAPYRVNGVLVVIGGWFVTALIAFTSSMLMATILHFGGTIATILMIALAFFVILRSHHLFKKREAA